MKKRVLFVVLASIVIGLPFSADVAKGNPAQKHEKVTIEIYSNPMGNAGYVLSFALTELINKNSEWLRATCLETVNSAENYRILAKNPGKSKVWIGFGGPCSVRQAEIGAPPFEKPILGMKAIALMTLNPIFLLTADHAIKTPEDLRGKRVVLFDVGFWLEDAMRGILDAGWNVYKDIKAVHISGFGRPADALINGTVDVVWMPGAAYGAGEPKEWQPIPASEKVMNARRCYPVPLTETAITAARKASGYPIYPVRLKAKKVGKTDLPEIIGFGVHNSWWCHEDMDEEVAAEMSRIIYEYAEDFQKYHAAGKALSKETVYKIPIPRDKFHRGAIKFYESKGLKPGLQ